MGVEYRHYLIPRPNSFSPTPEQLAGVVESFADGGWIAAPGTDALKQMAILNETTYDDAVESWGQLRRESGWEPVPRFLTPGWFELQLASDARVKFFVEHGDQMGLNYPLVNDGRPPEDPYYDIELHMSHEYVQHMSELIDPANTTCACGEALEFDTDPDFFSAPRIRTGCPNCGTPFDASSVPVVVRDGWTGQERIVSGGVIYRFAIVIDCGKCIPERKQAAIKANPTFVELCKKVLGCDFYEVGDVY